MVKWEIEISKLPARERGGFCFRMRAKEILERMVRFGSNWPLSLKKEEREVGWEVFDEKGQSKIGEIEPIEEGPQYLLGVISRGLRAFEKGKARKKDEEVFLNWLASRLVLEKMWKEYGEMVMGERYEGSVRERDMEADWNELEIEDFGEIEDEGIKGMVADWLEEGQEILRDEE